jgi:two-component system, OmpR family, heavy metal sensor histidine kinase CusS
MVGAAVPLLAAGLALRTIVVNSLQEEFDGALWGRAKGLASLTEQKDGRIRFEFESEHMSEFSVGSEPEYFELWLATGFLLRRSPSFDASDATRRASLVRDPDPDGTPRFQDLRLPDGRWGRQVQIAFVPSLDTPDPRRGRVASPSAAPPPLRATLIVAREREHLDAAVRRLQLVGVGLGAGLMLMLAGAMQLALRVGLRSLDRLTEKVRVLGISSLNTRIEVPAPPAEIAVVVEQVNALLSRLEAGFKRERQMSSDIAHELKTPIAELRNLSEVGARWPEDREAVRQFFDDTSAIAQHMERVVGHLLTLARYDEGRAAVWTAPVQVAEIVDSAWKPLAREAAARDIQLRQEIPATLHLDTDPEKFALIVTNLLSNAIAYSPLGTTILCESKETAERASVSFSNRAEHLDAQDLPVMFDRFWRKDEARTGGHGVGLGLAVVRALTDLLTIGVETRLTPDGMFRITLSMPLRS